MANGLVKSELEEQVIQNMSWPLYETGVALTESLFNKIPNETIYIYFNFFLYLIFVMLVLFVDHVKFVIQFSSKTTS